MQAFGPLSPGVLIPLLGEYLRPNARIREPDLRPGLTHSENRQTQRNPLLPGEAVVESA